MTLTKDESIGGTYFLWYVYLYNSAKIFIKQEICIFYVIFLELHDPLRQLVIMSESDKNIDKSQVEIVANAAAKIAVSFDYILK